MTGRALAAATATQTAARLIVVGCSAEKTRSTRALPALDFYDGGCVPPLRRRLGGHGELRDRVRFLSAEHGWITAGTPLHFYDRPLDPARAVDLRPRVAAAMARDFDAIGVPTELLVIAEPLYLVLIADLLALPERPRVHWIPDHAHGWPQASTVLDSWRW